MYYIIYKNKNSFFLKLVLFHFFFFLKKKKKPFSKKLFYLIKKSFHLNKFFCKNFGFIKITKFCLNFRLNIFFLNGKTKYFIYLYIKIQKKIKGLNVSFQEIIILLKYHPYTVRYKTKKHFFFFKKKEINNKIIQLNNREK
jgi:hypothetical protein